jgi:predicted nucleotidyltransferase component of viral defense system
VQIQAGPIGSTLDGLQAVLNGFLGEPKRKQTEEGATLTYRMDSEGPPVMLLRLKIEINTREHFAVQGVQRKAFKIASRWFTGSCEIPTFTLEELLATKLRALYQRRKGRDLFDIWLGLTEGGANAQVIVLLFKQYMAKEGHTITARDYDDNMQEKMRHPGFLSDLNPLLQPKTKYDAAAAFALLQRVILARL